VAPGEASLAGLRVAGFMAVDDEREYYVSILKEAESRLARNLGRSLLDPWTLRLNDTEVPVDGGKALAYTYLWEDAVCLIGGVLLASRTVCPPAIQSAFGV
ncbi:MAG: hypothetical protein OEX04_19785, partial [Acidimicrobiia bacterium]|nr:hypothetical protein [Acidimicrobiia bacterium]